MNITKQNLTEKQFQAIPFFIESKSVTEGLKKAGISRTTYYQWLKNENFQTEIEKQRQEIFNHSMDGLKTATTEAVVVIRGLLKSRSENIRLKAATVVLAHTVKKEEIAEPQPILKISTEQAHKICKTTSLALKMG